MSLCVLGACAGSAAPLSPTPLAGDPDDRAAPGETACEAATAAWPGNPTSTTASTPTEGHLPGLSACIVKGGDVVWCGAYGHKAGGSAHAVTTDTPFVWASVSKLVTATSVMMLAAEGAVDLDQAIDAQLSFTARHPDGAAIRPRALMAHVGGVADNYAAMDGYYDVNEDPTLSLAQVNRRYFEPGGADYSARRNFVAAGPEARNVYSNMGYSLLGSLVEDATGEDFADWTQQHIFGPLGMAHSGWRVSDFDLDALAEPTLWEGGAWAPQGHTTFADYPNGGLRSSAHDMACFLATAARGGSLYGTRLLEPADLYEMMAPAYPAWPMTRAWVGIPRTWATPSPGSATAAPSWVWPATSS